MFQQPKPLSEIMFNKFDADKSGHIDAGEFQQLCFALGYALSPGEVTLALKVIDLDGSGQVDCKEFTKWWKNSRRWDDLKLDEETLGVRQAAAEVFNSYDPGKSGKLATTDFEQFHADLVKNGMTTKDKDTCLADLDTSGDGAVQFNEYIDWLQRIGSIKVAAEAEAARSSAPSRRVVTASVLASAQLRKTPAPAPKAESKADSTGAPAKTSLARPPSTLSSPKASSASSTSTSTSTAASLSSPKASSSTPSVARTPSSVASPKGSDSSANAGFGVQLKPATQRQPSSTTTSAKAEAKAEAPKLKSTGFPKT